MPIAKTTVPIAIAFELIPNKLAFSANIFHALEITAKIETNDVVGLAFALLNKFIITFFN